MRKSILDEVPPESLIKDDLIGTFGSREQELAVKCIIAKAVLHKTWRVPLTTTDFETGDSYPIHGFQDLLTTGWIEPTRVINEYMITPDVVWRLKKCRPEAFK